MRLGGVAGFSARLLVIVAAIAVVAYAVVLLRLVILPVMLGAAVAALLSARSTGSREAAFRARLPHCS